MEKRAVIDNFTPPAEGPLPPAHRGERAEPQTKEAADRLDDHPLKRLQDAAARRDAGKSGK